METQLIAWHKSTQSRAARNALPCRLSALSRSSTRLQRYVTRPWCTQRIRMYNKLGEKFVLTVSQFPEVSDTSLRSWRDICKTAQIWKKEILSSLGLPVFFLNHIMCDDISHFTPLAWKRILASDIRITWLRYQHVVTKRPCDGHDQDLVIVPLLYAISQYVQVGEKLNYFLACISGCLATGAMVWQ